MQGWVVARSGEVGVATQMSTKGLGFASQSGHGHCAMTSIGILRVPQRCLCPAAQACMPPGSSESMLVPCRAAGELADGSLRSVNALPVL